MLIMSAYAETASSFYISPRRLVAGFLIATTLTLVAAKCDGGDEAGGKPRSPLDTNGTRGSGYEPPGGWGGGYMPKGMSEPGRTHTELPDEQNFALDVDKNQLATPEAITLPGDIMGTTTIVLSFGEEEFTKA